MRIIKESEWIGQMIDSLSNDDMSSDEEMVEFWKECGISDWVAKKVITVRPTFLIEPMMMNDRAEELVKNAINFNG